MSTALDSFHARFLVTVCGPLLVIGLVIVGVVAMFGPPSPDAGDAPILYTVQSGDTLKSVATCLGQDVDWRALVTTIERANPAVEGVGLRADEVIYIPAEITGGNLCCRLDPEVDCPT